MTWLRLLISGLGGDDDGGGGGGGTDTNKLLNILCAFSHLTLTTTLRGKYYNYLFFLKLKKLRFKRLKILSKVTQKK